MFGEKGLNRQRRHFDLLYLHLAPTAFGLSRPRIRASFLEAGEYRQIGSLGLMGRDEQADSAVFVGDGSAFKGKLLLQFVVLRSY